MLTYEGFAGIPGIDITRETIENVVTWGPTEYNRAFIVPALLDGAARDVGHTGNTTVLRPGLILTGITATKKFREWASGQRIGGILLYAAAVTTAGSNADKWFGYVLLAGNIKSSMLIVPGATNPGLVGNASEAALRTAFAGRFLLDDVAFA